MKAHIIVAPVFAALIAACSGGQEASFVEDRSQVKKVSLRASGAPDAADATAVAEGATDGATEADMGAVFDELDAATDGATDGEAGGGASDGASDGAVDGGEGAPADAPGSAPGGDGGVTMPDAGADAGASDGGGGGGASPGDETAGNGNGNGKGKGKGKGQSGNGAGDGGDSLPPEGGGTADPSAAELDACSKLTGVAANRIKIAGNHTSQQITLGSVAAIKLTGNQPRLELDIEGDAGASIAALCLFLAGNQARVDIKAGIDIGKLVYVGRGNRSDGRLEMLEGANLKALAGDLGGNGARLELKGAGKFPCQVVRLRGNGTELKCE